MRNKQIVCLFRAYIQRRTWKKRQTNCTKCGVKWLMRFCDINHSEPRTDGTKQLMAEQSRETKHPTLMMYSYAKQVAAVITAASKWRHLANA